jgi:hypothetical protein
VSAPEPITPGQVAADQFPDGVNDGNMQEFLAALGSTRKLNDAVAAVESTRAGDRPGPGDEFDAMHFEDAERRRFAAVVGRPPTGWEIAGPPAAGCHPCGRMGSGCEAHRRKLGTPIPLPPHPWPSDPGPDEAKHAPYSLTRSVAG